MSVQAMTWVFEHSASHLAARLVLLGIANHADKDGRNSWASVRQLSEEARCSERQVQYALRELEFMGEIVRIGSSVRRTHIYELPGMTTLFGEGADSAPAQIAPVQNIQGEQTAGRKIRRTRVQNPSKKGEQTAPEPRTNRPKNRPFSINQAFDEFWKVYPRQVGRPKAMLAYKRALKDATSEAILDGARRYRDDPNREDGYTAHPTTWLARAGWDDPPLPDRAPKLIGRADPPRPMHGWEAQREARRALGEE